MKTTHTINLSDDPGAISVLWAKIRVGLMDARSADGASQGSVAALAGCTQQKMSMVLRGLTPCALTAVVAFANAAGYRLSVVLEPRSPPPGPPLDTDPVPR